MLIKAKELKGFKLNGLDGEIGSVKEFYFDDKFWTVRYLVADTGGWLLGRQVLISPYALSSVNKEDKLININLTKKQIENSPPLESDKPVSRQYEEAYYGYYGSPMYWGGSNVWGPYSYIERDNNKWKEIIEEQKLWDPHLRSTYDVSGHNVQALDGEIGHVEDFIIDDETWAIRYLVISTKNWWPGKKVLVSPQWIERVSWSESKVYINLSRETIQWSPEYFEDALLTNKYERELHLHYNKQGYWADKPVITEHAQ